MTYQLLGVDSIFKWDFSSLSRFIISVSMALECIIHYLIFYSLENNQTIPALKVQCSPVQ